MSTRLNSFSNLLTIITNIKIGVTWRRLMFGKESLEKIKADIKLCEEKEKAFLYNKLSYLYREISNNQSFSYTLDAFKIARNLGDSYNIALSYLNQAYYFFIENHYETSLDKLNSALNEKFSDGNLFCEIILLKAEIFEKLYQNTDAEAAYLLAYENATQMSQVYVARIASKLALFYRHLGQRKKSNYYAEMVINYYSEKEADKYYLDAIMTIGSNYWFKGDYGKALELYQNALRICTQLKDENTKLTALNNIGLVYFRTGNHQKALEFFFESLKIKESVGNKNGIALTLINVGIVYKNLKQFGEAIEYFTKALKIYKHLRDLKGISMAYNNLGNILYENKDHAQALAYYNKALEIKEKIGDAYGLAVARKNIADVYFLQKEYKLALDFASKSFTDSKDSEDNWLNAASLNLIGRIYSKTGEYEMAEKYLKQSLDLSILIQSNEHLLDNYKTLSELYSKRNDYENAYRYLCNYTNIFEENRNTNEISPDLKSKMEKERIEQESERYKNENQEMQKIINELEQSNKKYKATQKRLEEFNDQIEKTNQYLINEIYTRLQAEKDLEVALQKLEESNKTKDKLFSIISHDLRTPLNSILLSAEVVKKKLRKSEQADIFEKIEIIVNKTETIRLLLEELLTWSRLQLDSFKCKIEKINVKILLDETISLLTEVAQAKDINVINKTSPEFYACGDINMVKTIFRNLISNAIKFSYRKSEITISANNDISYCNILIQDNGIGINTEQLSHIFDFKKSISTIGTENEKGTGLGLPLSKEFVDRNKGKIAIASELGKGTLFTVSLPVEKIV